eukprot:GHVN01040745.1.p1 GENE.GHVN01040745.1~~GHVN01040745.1.p1  ORF type:complete len:474 (+),score=64.53 GHVN01040745.1:444-1865(+)
MGCTSSSAKTGGEDIRRTYKIGAVLGSGSFGQVRLCTRLDNGEVYAVKIMAKTPPKKSSKVDHEHMFKNEVDVLQTLSHSNVVRFLEFFEDKHFLYAVMEKCDGGELFTRIVKQRKFNEEHASVLTRQMLDAIEYVHSLQIVHRDIKAENFLFKGKEEMSNLLLIDFGMAIRLQDDKQLTQLCGSPHYVAPELIRRQYRFQVDMWALGVMIYLMLFGKYPFEAQDHKTIIQQILKHEPDYTKGSIQPSVLAVDFMKKLLAKNPETRMSATEALRHPWVSGEQAEKNAHHMVPVEVVREAHRKTTLERDDPDSQQQRDMESKLAKLQSDYARGRSTSCHRRGSGVSDHEHDVRYDRGVEVEASHGYVRRFSETQSHYSCVYEAEDCYENRLPRDSLGEHHIPASLAECGSHCSPPTRVSTWTGTPSAWSFPGGSPDECDKQAIGSVIWSDIMALDRFGSNFKWEENFDYASLGE